MSQEDGDRQKIRLKTAATVDQTKEFFLGYLQLLRPLQAGDALLQELKVVISEDVRELRNPGCWRMDVWIFLLMADGSCNVIHLFGSSVGAGICPRGLLL